MPRLPPYRCCPIVMRMDDESREWLRGALERDVDRSDPDGCWPWKKSVDANGFATAYVPDRYRTWHPVRVHRAVFNLDEEVPVPSNVPIKQTCGNRRCCRRDHLAMGSRSEPRGGNRLDARQITEVRLARSHGMTLAQIASRFGISTSYASRLTKTGSRS